MRRTLLLLPLALLVLAPVAQPAVRPPSYLLAVAAGGTVSLLQSADSIRFAAAPGYAAGAGTAPAVVRRGSTLSLFGQPALSGDTLAGPLRRFAVGAGGRLTELPAATYQVQLASPADAANASPGSFVPSIAVDAAGALVLLYTIRLEPETNACPTPGQACLKLRTATEVAGSDGTAFTGDPGNRAVLVFAPAQAPGPPALLRAATGWAVLLQGANGCLQALTASSPHGAYRNGGCISSPGPASPSGLWSAALGEYRLYGVAGGRVVRAIAGTLTAQIPPARFRPLGGGLPGQPAAARIAADAP